jgi:hypothetical protein
MENIDRELTAGDTPNAPVHLKILRAPQEVGGPMFFSTIIFVIAFPPVHDESSGSAAIQNSVGEK